MPPLIASSTPFTPLVIAASTPQAKPDGTDSRHQNTGGENAPVEPRLEAYLTGEALALACASSMPLPAVARANHILYRYAREGDGYSLTEAPLYRLLARCGLSEQETKWMVFALDGEGYGKVPVWDVLVALVVFYPGHRAAAAAAAAAATTAGGSNMQQLGLREFKMRYQRQVRAMGSLNRWALSTSHARTPHVRRYDQPLSRLTCLFNRPSIFVVSPPLFLFLPVTSCTGPLYLIRRFWRRHSGAYFLAYSTCLNGYDAVHPRTK